MKQPQSSTDYWISKGGIESLTLWLIVAIAALVAVSLSVYWEPTRDEPTAPPPAYSLKGQIRLSSGQFIEGGGTCSGTGDYAEVQAGAVVAVTDEGGSPVSNSFLDAGVRTADGCTFAFSADAPAGKGAYGINLPRFGELRYSEAQFANLLELAIG